MRICGWVNWGGGGSGRSWVNFCTKGRMEEEEQGRSGREVCGPRWNVCAAIKISIKNWEHSKFLLVQQILGNNGGWAGD